MSLLWPVVALLAIGFAAVSSSADEGEDIWRGLLANPPTVPQTDARIEAVKALDTIIKRADSERSPELIGYYRGAVDRVLHLLETERVETGMRVFQLYSSSTIVQTPTAVFAIDLDQGPNKKLTMTPEEEGVPLCMTDEQVARFTALIDYSFHTHEHHDHVDYEITRALMAAGKPVIVTTSIKKIWADQPWADKLVVLEQTLDEPHTLGPLQVDVMCGHQWMNDDHTNGVLCNAWLITTEDGVSILAKGDINCGLRLYGWLQLMAQNGRHVDMCVGSTGYWKGVNTLSILDELLLAPVWAPGHHWEFTHRPSGQTGGACGWFLSYAGVFKRVVNLTWGEYLDVTAG